MCEKTFLRNCLLSLVTWLSAALSCLQLLFINLHTFPWPGLRTKNGAATKKRKTTLTASLGWIIRSIGPWKPHLSAGAPAEAPSVSNIPFCRSVSFRGSSSLRRGILQESRVVFTPLSIPSRGLSYTDILVQLCSCHEVKVEQSGRLDRQLSHWRYTANLPLPLAAYCRWPH